MKKLTMVVLLVGCVDEPELAVETDEVLSPNGVIVNRAACSMEDTTDANITRFRNTLNSDLLPRMRTYASSPAFRECIRRTMNIGGSQLRSNRWQYPSGVLQTFGPVMPHTADVGYQATRDLPEARVRDIYAERILAEAVSPNPLVINCQVAGGGWANGIDPSRDFAGFEDISLSKDFFNEEPAFTGTPTNRGFRSFTAAVMWHELMHERNYWHSEIDANYNNRVPAIVGACMDETFNRTEETCRHVSCDPGFLAALNDFEGDGGSCACYRDPGAGFRPTLAGSWSWKGLIKVVLDASGQAYALSQNKTGTFVFKRDGQNWTQLASALDVVAGGDVVSIKQPSPVIGAPPQWWMIPRVGPQTAISSVPGEVMAVDDFGRWVRQLNGEVHRRRWTTPWVNLGPATTIATGSDVLYKISNGVASRLDDGVAPTWTSLGGANGAITADTYGTLYVLASDQSLWRHRGTLWEPIGGPNDQIGAGQSFFTHSPVDGNVYRRGPDNNWHYVAPCTSFVAGGRSLWCRRGITLELYEY